MPRSMPMHWGAHIDQCGPQGTMGTCPRSNLCAQGSSRVHRAHHAHNKGEPHILRATRTPKATRLHGNCTRPAWALCALARELRGRSQWRWACDHSGIAHAKGTVHPMHFVRTFVVYCNRSTCALCIPTIQSPIMERFGGTVTFSKYTKRPLSHRWGGDRKERLGDRDLEMGKSNKQSFLFFSSLSLVLPKSVDTQIVKGWKEQHSTSAKDPMKFNGEKSHLFSLPLYSKS